MTFKRACVTAIQKDNLHTMVLKRNEQELMYERLDSLKGRINDWQDNQDMPSDKCEVIICDLKCQKDEVLWDKYNMAQENIDNSTK